MDFEHGIEKGNGKTVNREQEHMPPEHLDEDIAATTIATRWNNARRRPVKANRHTRTPARTPTWGMMKCFLHCFYTEGKGELDGRAGESASL